MPTNKTKLVKCSVCGSVPVKAKGKCGTCYKREYNQIKREIKREIAYQKRQFWRDFKKRR